MSQLKRTPQRPGLRPFLLVNMAMTADGKITTVNRAASGFGGRRDRDHLFELRATADAVMAGARTVDLDPVTLGPGPLRTGACVSVAASPNIPCASSSAARAPSIPTPRSSRNPPRSPGPRPIIILTTQRAGKRIDRLRRVADDVRVCGASRIDFAAALGWLRKRWGVKRLLCEGGGELNDALFRAGLVDELHLTVCPKIFGGRDAPTVSDGLGVPKLAGAASLILTSMKRAGPELFLVYRRDDCG